jgi:MFS family permease
VFFPFTFFDAFHFCLSISGLRQDIFKGRVTPLEAAGIVGLFSLFNIFGRLFWSSISDLVGRWGVYTGFFVAGMGLYACVPVTGHAGNFPAFFVVVAVIVSMYGGGFAVSHALEEVQGE